MLEIKFEIRKGSKIHLEGVGNGNVASELDGDNRSLGYLAAILVKKMAKAVGAPARDVGQVLGLVAEQIEADSTVQLAPEVLRKMKEEKDHA